MPRLCPASDLGVSWPESGPWILQEVSWENMVTHMLPWSRHPML